MKSLSDYAIVVLILMAMIVGWTIRYQEPPCKEGYVASFVLFKGWHCVPGYKP